MSANVSSTAIGRRKKSQSNGREIEVLIEINLIVVSATVVMNSNARTTPRKENKTLAVIKPMRKNARLPLNISVMKTFSRKNKDHIVAILEVINSSLLNTSVTVTSRREKNRIVISLTVVNASVVKKEPATTSKITKRLKKKKFQVTETRQREIIRKVGVEGEADIIII